MQTETDPDVAPDAAGPRHFAPRRRRRLLRLLLVLLGVLVVAAVVLGIYVNGKINPSSTGADVQLTVPKGASTAEISRILEGADVIDNATLFRLYVRFKNVGQFQAGDYTLRRHQPYGQIVATMREGAEVTVD